MILLDAMVSSGRLEEFVNELIKTHNEELEDKSLWELWLHKVFDKGFDEFKNSLGGKHEKAAPTQEEIKSIAMDSMNILAGFVLDEGLVNRNGTVQAAGYDSD